MQKLKSTYMNTNCGILTTYILTQEAAIRVLAFPSGALCAHFPRLPYTNKTGLASSMTAAIHSPTIHFPQGDLFGSAYRAMKAMHFLHQLINRSERRSRQYLRYILLEVTGLTI